MPEFRLAGVVAGTAATFAGLFWVAVLVAPSLERVWQADPLDDFISARTLLPPSPEAIVGRQLVREADAARRQDLKTALALWDPQGEIRDYAFTPDLPEDDHVWLGGEAIRRRYEEEFRLRRYRQLRHLNLDVTFRGDDEATIVNDLDATIETDQQAARVLLNRTDRWTFRRTGEEWRIVKLEVNRARRSPDEGTATRLTVTRRQE
jgi:hypothetical protein